jgi:hypothetical protein
VLVMRLLRCARNDGVGVILLSDLSNETGAMR